MMDISEIERMNKEAEKQAERNKIEPYLAKCDGDVGVRKAPFIGDFTPKGWRKKALYFVDSSGLGSRNEPALTFDTFLEYVKEGLGYALVECGQFQVYIAEFEIMEE